MIIGKLFPKLGKDQLWTNQGYYLWGLILLIVYLIIKPYDYIVKKPINNEVGIVFIVIYLVVAFFVCKAGLDFYYPKKSNKLKCFHYGVIQPIFEEIAFRGLILPMTIQLLGNNFSIVIWINGIIFMVFHWNYWSLNKKNINLFLNFLCVGLSFAYLSFKTQSILYSIIGHIIINSCNVIYRNYKLSDKSK